MTTLYVMPGTCALAPNIAVSWTGAPISVHALARGEHRQAEYLRINPKGQVPALMFDDGEVLTEATAILSYIGSAFRAEDFSYETQIGRREAEALSYMSSEVHVAFAPHFAPQRFVENEDLYQPIRDQAYRMLAGHFERLNTNLEAGGDWYLGTQSFADTYLYVLSRWIDLTPLSISTYPALERFRTRMEADAGVREALSRQNMEPLG